MKHARSCSNMDWKNTHISRRWTLHKSTDNQQEFAIHRSLLSLQVGSGEKAEITEHSNQAFSRLRSFPSIFSVHFPVSLLRLCISHLSYLRTKTPPLPSLVSASPFLADDLIKCNRPSCSRNSFSSSSPFPNPNPNPDPLLPKTLPCPLKYSPVVRPNLADSSQLIPISPTGPSLYFIPYLEVRLDQSDLRMEAKESSTVPAATALAGSKDGPVSDESRLSDARGLAKEAAFLFQSRRLQECIDVLNQLLQKKHDDAKVCGGLSLDCMIVWLDF
ncbi:hypothetical protein BHE74_00006021 [Ensete ventricosum]|nr:hypothetical protein GW17_00007418 [Ensete ventricosum]RWW85313.1 hypothetical protein BHE74_00006021 [Ensete ventricosum]